MMGNGSRRLGNGGVGLAFYGIKFFCGTTTNVKVLVKQLRVGMEIKKKAQPCSLASVIEGFFAYQLANENYFATSFVCSTRGQLLICHLSERILSQLHMQGCCNFTSNKKFLNLLVFSSSFFFLSIFF